MKHDGSRIAAQFPLWIVEPFDNYGKFERKIAERNETLTVGMSMHEIICFFNSIFPTLLLGRATFNLVQESCDVRP